MVIETYSKHVMTFSLSQNLCLDAVYGPIEEFLEEESKARTRVLLLLN